MRAHDPGGRPDRRPGTLPRGARLLLALAARVVPASHRHRWREEWEAELDAAGRRTGRVWRHAWGAVPHAFWIRREEGGMMGTWGQDVRIATRRLARQPGFTVSAVTMLALGIGGATAMFGVVDEVLLDPLPYPDGNRLVWMWGSRTPPAAAGPGSPAAGTGFGSVSPPDLRDYRAADLGFAGLAAIQFAGSAVLSAPDGPAEVTTAAATADLLAVLGLEPALGRSFTPEETRGSTATAAMLSHQLWTERYGADPDVVGRRLTVADQPYTVVGVLPPELEAPFARDVWIPVTWGDDGWTERRYHFLRPIGRLGNGVTVEQVQERLDGLSRRLEALHPDTNTRWQPLLRPLDRVLVGTGRAGLLLLMGATVLVLGLACANVANLLVARAGTRGPEMGVRTALGASRGRLVRQLLTESLVLAAAGGIAGAGAAHLFLGGLLGLAPRGLPGIDRVSLDPGVLLGAVVATVLVGILFGLAPALHLVRGRSVAGSAAGRVSPGGRLSGALAVGEVAMTLVVLVASGLLGRSLLALRAVDAGFDPEGIQVSTLRLPEARIPDPLDRTQRLDRILERVEALPGVTAVAAANGLPLAGAGGDIYLWPEESPPEHQADASTTAQIRSVTEDYPRALGIALLAGRFFAPSDGPDAPRRVVVNQALVDRFYDGEIPVGRRLMVDLGEPTPLEIIGVVAGVREFSPARPPIPTFYLSMRQSFQPDRMELAVATDRPVSATALRTAVREVEPEQTLADLRSYDEIVATVLSSQRFLTTILGLFAAVALALATVGVYGMAAHLVAQRRRSIGIRLALGARPGRVLLDVVRHGLGLGLLGILLGGAVALLVGPQLRGLLFQVDPTDPLTLTAAPLFLLLLVLASTWIPARRAAGVDPVGVLSPD